MPSVQKLVNYPAKKNINTVRRVSKVQNYLLSMAKFLVFVKYVFCR